MATHSSLQSLREGADSLFRRLGDPAHKQAAAEAAAGPAAFDFESACVSSCEYAAALAALREAHAALKSEAAAAQAAAATSGASCSSSSGSGLAHECALGYDETLGWLQETAIQLTTIAEFVAANIHTAAAAHSALVSLFLPWLWVLDAAGAEEWYMEVLGAAADAVSAVKGALLAAVDEEQRRQQPQQQQGQRTTATRGAVRTRRSGASSTGGGQAAGTAAAAAASGRTCCAASRGNGGSVVAAAAAAAAGSLPAAAGLQRRRRRLTCPSTGQDVRACRCPDHDPQALLDLGESVLKAVEATVCSQLAALMCGGFDTLPVRAADALRGHVNDMPAAAAAAAAAADGGRLVAAAATAATAAEARTARQRDEVMDAVAASVMQALVRAEKLHQVGADAPLRAALGSREVRRLQVVLLERLAVHGGSGSGSGSSIQGWLARYEAREGRIVEDGSDEGATASSAERAEQLEGRHALWLFAGLGPWRLATEVWGDPPPPLALQLRLAARAAEALCRLSGCAGGSSASHGSSRSHGGSCGGTQQQHNAVGLGLGGASYGPEPSFAAVCGDKFFNHPEFLSGAFRCSKQLRALPSTAAREALLPDALEGAAWWLRLQAAALRRHQPAWLAATPAKAADADATAASEEPMAEVLWTLVDRSLYNITDALSSARDDESDDAGLLHEASSHCRAAALAVVRRTGLLGTLDQLLRLAAEAVLALHDCRLASSNGGRDGAASDAAAVAAAAAAARGSPRQPVAPPAAAVCSSAAAAAAAVCHDDDDDDAELGAGLLVLLDSSVKYGRALLRRLEWLADASGGCDGYISCRCTAAIIDGGSGATATSCTGSRLCVNRCLARITSVVSNRSLRSILLLAPRAAASRAVAAAAAAASPALGPAGAGSGAAGGVVDPAANDPPAEAAAAVVGARRNPAARQLATLAEARAHVLQAVCELGVRVTRLPAAVARVTGILLITTAAQELWADVATASAATELVATSAAGATGSGGPEPLSAPQLLACQPHCLIAATAAALQHYHLIRKGVMQGMTAEMRHDLTRGLLRALAAAGSHPLLSIELLTWLAPPPPPAVPRSKQQRAEAAAAFDPDGGPLRGCLRERLRSALPFMLIVDSNALPGRPEANRAQAAAIAGLLELAAGWAQSCGGSTSTSSSKHGKSSRGGAAAGVHTMTSAGASAEEWRQEFRRHAEEALRWICDQPAAAGMAAAIATTITNNGTTAVVLGPGVAAPGVTAALAALRLPVTGAPLLSLLGRGSVGGGGGGVDGAKAKKPTTAERVRQRRLQQGAGGGAGGTATGVQWGAHPLPPPLDIAPAAVALWRLRVCGNPGCEAFGSSRCEAELDLRLCGRCKSVRYCSTACQAAHWRSGHGAVCGRVAAAVAAAVCEKVTAAGAADVL
ncbi:hypothetical protein HYH02_005662 [Chlamydomonas schloesseri]|uniref:MYND-type domain-containing protein n=1 Tax=Chlamydomonas schloesseri TaxID=2026947 RepID=A0A835WMQ1_9CHLO|nr:hypothetical protein HYH02_005662 [Chlamydomonas schloesseri]|eukprot:KAG2449520.1 hypothetical protein HYH02_005662 [Chlamydomonas schloesseri]